MNLKNRFCKGFTLIEIMVVIVIMGVLAAVAVPKLFNITEKAHEEIDLLKLFWLRDALNRAMIDDADALYKSNEMSANANLQTELSNALKTSKGAYLFVMQLYAGNKINIQPVTSNGQGSMGKVIGSGGTWVDALNEARFDGVADIILKRYGKDNNQSTYTTTKNSDHGNWTITTPKTPIFQSNALNSPVKSQVNGDGQVNLFLQVQWTGMNEKSHSVEVFLTKDYSDWNNAFRGGGGICFSTYGEKACK